MESLDDTRKEVRATVKDANLLWRSVSEGGGRPGSPGQANRMNAKFRYAGQEAEVTRARAYQRWLYLRMKDLGNKHGIDLQATIDGKLSPDGTPPTAQMLRLHALWLGATMAMNDAIAILKDLLRGLMAAMGKLPRDSCPATLL